MEKLNTTKIEAITVSINYSDYLSQIISNKEKLDRWIIVTHEDDSDCIKVCEDNDIEYICSKRIYEDGSYFAKGKAINEGLELLDKDSWILHVDSDICLPDDFREIVQDNLNNKEKLYWNRRYDKETLEEIKWITEDENKYELIACGFFHLWHSDKVKKYIDASNNAGWDDVYFKDSFGENLVELPLKCIDVSGELAKHHFGRNVVLTDEELNESKWYDPLGKYFPKPKKIKVYNRSCEEDYFETQKLFWWEPFYSNSKYEIVYDYDNPEKCDIVYSNIFNYADQPFEAYDDNNLILCPQPLYKKEENLKYNVKSVPLLMLEHAKIIEKYDINELRDKKRTYNFGFIGNLNHNYKLDNYPMNVEGLIKVDEDGYSRTHYYEKEEFLEVNREIIDYVLIDSFYERTSDIIWGMEESKKIKTMEKYLDDLSQCTFVLCPRGTGTSSFRLYETLMMGSIPIITGMKDYPFDDEYDWESFSLRTDSIKDLQYLIDTAQKLSDKDVEEMKHNGTKFYDEKCRPDVFNDWVIETYLL